MKRLGFFQALRRRSESGQSIIILAIAFVALLGFVGIVTDVSLLFVRYSALRRAVDAAAVSAAGQMRTDRDFATVGLSARTFIEFYGISPDFVDVQTCLTAPGDPQLCTADQRKLVRVIARIDSPTVFMRLLGFRDIPLTAQAISETAVMDIVLVIDVSESMANATSVFPINLQNGIDDDYSDIGMGYIYRPPSISYGAINQDQAFARWEYLNTRTQWDASQVAAVGDDPVADPANPDRWPATTALDPTQRTIPFRTTAGGQTLQPRADCQVRFYPNYSRNVETGDPTWSGFLNAYTTLFSQSWNVVRGGVARWDGYVPTFNFYGCCNDPGNGTVGLNGDIVGPTSSIPDLRFYDLICQPFKQARDAMRDFLQRVDFFRGDRVALVTFNRTAFILDPDGNNPGGATHMMDTFPMALETLNRSVGVNAEPTFYNWDEATGVWSGFAAGLWDHDSNPATPDDSLPLNYNAPPTTPPNMSNTQVTNHYPVYSNCHMMNAAQGYPFSPYTSYGNQAARLQVGTSPATRTIIPPYPFDYPTTSSTGLTSVRSYTYRGACRDANVGAALREANNALTNPTTQRVSGAVWVIILISDGAAGASDPVLVNGTRPPAPNPYQTPVSVGAYGSFGVCPFPSFTDSPELPFCSDSNPEERHFCGFDAAPPAPGAPVEPLDLADPQCALYTDPQGALLYDVDDYARDWADWVGLLERAGGSGAIANQVMLPTIFTIGFGITYGNTFPSSCPTASNLDDCVGEELLRYIADVGDNFQLDIDYQQDWTNDGQLNNTPNQDGWGPRGVCEGAGTPGTIARLTPRASCGNYYNAPNSQQLGEVFDDIASKMFTRIAN